MLRYRHTGSESTKWVCLEDVHMFFICPLMLVLWWNTDEHNKWISFWPRGKKEGVVIMTPYIISYLQKIIIIIQFFFFLFNNLLHGTWRQTVVATFVTMYMIHKLTWRWKGNKRKETEEKEIKEESEFQSFKRKGKLYKKN